MKNKDETYKLIDASLFHGRVPHADTWTFCCFILVTCGLMLLWQAIWGVLVLIGNVKFTEEDSWRIVLGICMLASVIGTAIFLAKQRKLKKDIYLWLDDAIKVVATTYTVDTTPRNATKLKVKLRYKKHIYNLYSGDPYKYAVFTNAGFSRSFTKFADKQVEVLYSPKYQQVLFLYDTQGL